jgi:hypothetical protein
MRTRSRDDVFVIGEEPHPAEAEAPGSPERPLPADDQEPDGLGRTGLDRPPCAGRGRPRALRWLGALGVGATASAVLALVELSGGGHGHRSAERTSRAAPRVTLPSAPTAEPPAQPDPPSPVQRHRGPGREPPDKPRHRSPDERQEPEREPTYETAPISSPSPPPATSAAPPEAPAAAPSPPTPPPSPPRGGGAGGEEEFGFER